MASFDYKKEYKEFYLPPKQPHIIKIPKMNFLAVHGPVSYTHLLGERLNGIQEVRGSIPLISISKSIR